MDTPVSGAHPCPGAPSATLKVFEREHIRQSRPRRIATSFYEVPTIIDMSGATPGRVTCSVWLLSHAPTQSLHYNPIVLLRQLAAVQRVLPARLNRPDAMQSAFVCTVGHYFEYSNAKWGVVWWGTTEHLARLAHQMPSPPTTPWLPVALSLKP